MGLPHIPHIIIYTTNDTILKNKRKSNDARYLVTGVHRNVIRFTKLQCKRILLTNL